ncbi:MAG: DUF4270 family protein, partial [Bacteroidia bacterium]|nr:DUF4270 domain-containing protein [Bacteroidia bacterium]MDW8333753.1 DUF4270 family protein [Bacteroidia bacterium]
MNRILCAIVFAAGMFASACKKPDDVGAGLITGANVEYNDSIDVELTTFRIETVPTGVPALGFFGELLDPVLGLQTAALYTQFLPLQNDIRLKEAVYDSLVLVLDVTAFRGDRVKALVLQVHELADSLSLGASYGIESSVAVKAEELSGGYRVAVADSAFGIKQFRVRLSDELGRRLIGADSAYWARPANLKQWFYGLRIGAVRQSP